LRSAAAGVGIDLVEIAHRIGGLDLAGIGRYRANVGQAQPRRQSVAMLEGFGKMLLRVEKDHRRRGINGRDEVEQHRRIRAEGRNDRRSSRCVVLQHIAHHVTSRLAGEQPVERGPAGMQPDGITRHRAPP
jgi:hypothetical protein